MTREELIKNLNYTMKKHEHDRVATFGTNISLMCKDMLDYLKQEPKCESCELNRQRFMQTLDVAFELGKTSAEPKTGHWIIIDDCEKFIAKCSECGQIEDSRMIGKYAYCHCGAKMVEPQEKGGQINESKDRNI